METSTNRLDTLWCQLAVIAQRDGCATIKDISTFNRRARSEGDSFRTQCLAGLGRHILASLRNGVWNESMDVRFRRKPGSVLPLFLYDGFSRVFDDRGVLKPHSVIAEVAVNHLRQLTAVFSKLPIQCAAKLDADVQERFIANEREIELNPGLLEDFSNRLFTTPHGAVIKGSSILEKARKLIARVLCNSDPRDINPRHGSGASACGTRPWDRYGSFRYDSEIDRLWPYSSFFYASANHLVDELHNLQTIGPLPRQAKGILVPKDYRGNRLISCEPRELTYIQQGLMSLIVDTIEGSSLAQGFVNFTDQSINQQLARLGSLYCDRDAREGVTRITGSHVHEKHGVKYTVWTEIRNDRRALATLDLKDASDMLRWDVVQNLFPPAWSDALGVCRSTHTLLPNGKRVELRKHAPMGSSVCFPVMALTIWAVIKAAFNRTPVWVYGDDVIVPDSYAVGAMTVLEAIGFKVNRDKSFYGATPFRESCGGEFYMGTDVTPIKLGTTMEHDLGAMSSYISFVNNITRKYGIYANQDMIEYAANLTGCPVIGPDQQVYAEDNQAFVDAVKPAYAKVGESNRAFVLDGPDHLVDYRKLKRKWHAGFQTHMYRLRVPRPVYVNVDSNSYSWVLRYFLQGGREGQNSRCALARRTRYKYGWVAIG